MLGLGGGSAILGGLGVPVSAFAGALGALFLIEWIATVDGRLTVYTVLLTGAIFNAFSAALIYFLQSVASLEQLHAIVFYLMGRVPSLGARHAGADRAGGRWRPSWRCSTMSRDYNSLALGEEGAQ